MAPYHAKAIALVLIVLCVSPSSSAGRVKDFSNGAKPETPLGQASGDLTADGLLDYPIVGANPKHERGKIPVAVNGGNR